MSEKSLLCVHAHPDDEAIGTGGLLAKSAAAGVRTGVVTCTDGFLADGSSVAPEGTRTRELAASLAILGAGEPRLLGYHDSGGDGRAPDSFCAAPFDEAVSRLVGQLREFRPETVVTYDALGVTGHPDHIRAHRITLAAVEAAAVTGLYPEAGPAWRVRSVRLLTVALSLAHEAVQHGVWRNGLGTPDEEVDAFVDVRPWLDTKWKALQQHASELERSATLRLVLDPVVREGFLGTECYLWRAGPGARLPHRDGEPLADDLFADSRRS